MQLISKQALLYQLINIVSKNRPTRATQLSLFLCEHCISTISAYNIQHINNQTGKCKDYTYSLGE